MFERYVSGRTDRSSKSKGLAFAASVLANAGLIAGVLFWSFWKIERVHGKGVPVTFRASIAPPAPPPALGVAEPKPVSKVKAPPKPRDVLSQPAAKPVADPPPDEPGGEPEQAVGTPEGVAGGDPTSTGGDPDGIGKGPVEPPVVVVPKNVPIDGVEAMRIAGTRAIPLPQSVKVTMVAQGMHDVSATVKLCLDTEGVPNRVELVRPTAFDEANHKILAEVGAWRYRPYRVNGVPVPVCTAVVFKYQIE